MAKVYKNMLLVEGEQDKRVIPYLIEANGISWGSRENPVVYITPYGGSTKVVDPAVISSELKASGRTALGLMIDADENPTGRWQSVRNACLSSIPDIPNDLPEAGLVHSAPNGVKFGVWIMPDNRLRGMLETFYLA